MMHLYWRVIEELKLMGETWIFNDPSLQRSYQSWLKKNAGAIAQCLVYEPFDRASVFEYNGIVHSLS
jgi:hypothetical protein